jgi:hypothetical protein
MIPTIVIAGINRGKNGWAFTFGSAKCSLWTEKFSASNELVKFGKTFLLA